MVNEEALNRMAELLKSGATMLEHHCPHCNSPLFKIHEEVLCTKCNKQVTIVREGEDLKVTSSVSVNRMEGILLTKIQETLNQISEEKEIHKQEKLSRILLNWLEALEKIKQIKNK